MIDSVRCSVAVPCFREPLFVEAFGPLTPPKNIGLLIAKELYSAHPTWLEPMPILPGRRLGPYEILSAIGAGGMGEVYKARDTRLDRIVAIKVLPTHLADRAELCERFDREAKTIASLNHPHICTLYDTGHQDEIDFLVMEYIEGETLAQRLQKGPLPLDQVLRYAIEIADALDKAHRKGITHRDLKPGNIMLTKSGTKLLDFGLAKLKQEVGPGNVRLSELPTAIDPLTAKGTIVGTLEYMAPEQLEGKEVDARTDIFAFGAVVYEMATGKRAFEGTSQASLIAAILEKEPPAMSSLQPMTPPALDRVVKRCLAKDSDDRWQTVRDLEVELKWIAETGAQAGMSVPIATKSKSRERLAWSAAVILLVVALAFGAFTYLQGAPEDARTIRFFVSLPESWNFTRQLAATGAPPAPLAVSPDGYRIAFAATNTDGKSLLWIRPLDTLTAQALAGTEGAVRPFWSPYSRFLGFFADGKLKKIEVSGGPPITLCDSSGGGGGAWSRDGVIVFSPAPFSALEKVSASGGTPSPATKLSPGDVIQVRPGFLPDGRHFLYRTGASGQGGPAYLASLDSADRKLLLNADSTNVLYSQGYLLFLRDKTLMAQRFDTRRLALIGDEFPIAESIQTQGTVNPYGLFSASENGVLVYQAGSGTGGSQLVWFDRTGKQIGVLGDSTANADPEISPDGKRLLDNKPPQAGNTVDIWVYDLARGLPTRFTFGDDAFASIWSPDGSGVVFNSRRKGHLDLYKKASSGAGAEEPLLADNFDKYPLSWSPDGRFILYRSAGASTDFNLFVLPLSGDRKPFPFLNSDTKFAVLFGQFSPDGRWVAYTSTESGRTEIYVAPFPGAGGKWQISTGGGSSPRWRRDGTEIFYLSPDNKLMVAAVNGKGPSIEVGAVRPLFQTNSIGSASTYAVSADGQRFLINTVPEQAASAPIAVVLNWTAGLKK
jgi:eukaryotic-like serine/threonine-protein kinase